MHLKKRDKKNTFEMALVFNKCILFPMNTFIFFLLKYEWNAFPLFIFTESFITHVLLCVFKSIKRSTALVH